MCVPSPIIAPSSTIAVSCALFLLTLPNALVESRALVRHNHFELVLDPVEDLLVLGEQRRGYQDQVLHLVCERQLLAFFVELTPVRQRSQGTGHI